MRSFSFSRLATLHLRPTILALAMSPFALLAACGSDSTTGPVAVPVAGVRPMKTANSKPVPTTFTDASGKKLTIQSGSLSITAGNKFALAYVGHLGAIDFDLTEEGSVSVNGNTLTFTPDDGDAPFSGSRSGNSIVAGFKIAGVKFDLAFYQ